MKEKLKNKFLGIHEISDNKQKSIVLLLIWLVFIGIVVVYVRSYNTSNNVLENKIEFDSLERIFNRYHNELYPVISEMKQDILNKAKMFSCIMGVYATMMLCIVHTLPAECLGKDLYWFLSEESFIVWIIVSVMGFILLPTNIFMAILISLDGLMSHF